MLTWSDYIDESYNNRTFCVGGWMTLDDKWSKISASWQERLNFENRISAKKGFPPISRYHATDCANLKKEFAEDKGWDIPRQIRLSKRICQIIGENAPIGIVVGGGVKDFRKYFPQEIDDFKSGLYQLSLRMHLIEVAYIMMEHFPDDRVTIYYDRTREFGPLAKAAFDQFMKEDGVAHLSKYFAAMLPKSWEACIPLQPADFLAYEGMKRLDQHLQGSDAVRKALQALVGADVLIVSRGYTSETYEALLQITNNKLEGKEPEEPAAPVLI